MQTFERFLLPNGVRVILVPNPQSLATTVAVLVEAGSKYETKELNGISHFLEHMCFKGTTKRPRPIDIANELDGLGAEYNAFTGQEYTGYHAKVKNEHFHRALDIVTDLYLHPTFNPGEIEKEKGVIIEEINMYEDLPQRRVGEFFMELVYGDQPAGWSVAGEKDVIRRIARDDFVKYRGAHYLPQATTVVVAGGFDVAKAKQNIEAHFGAVLGGEKAGKPKVVEEQKVPRELVRFKESDQTHLVLGFRAFDLHDERRYALELLADILGGGMGSRLFQRVREELGAAYYVRAATDLYSDHGLIEMSAGVTHGKLKDVIKAGLEEFTRFTTERVDGETLDRAKRHVTGQFVLSLETSDAQGYFYGGQEVMGLPLMTPDEYSAKLQAVSAEEIQKVAQNLFVNDRLNLALIGPYKDASFLDILKT
ncbi:MAG: pitrilysin family protein [Candidatus Jorgensenbacteria bacterium]|nr:pitrilysin family protein [Candidatus Jorgensenbacteria bacterium]